VALWPALASYSFDGLSLRIPLQAANCSGPEADTISEAEVIPRTDVISEAEGIANGYAARIYKYVVDGCRQSAE